MRFLFSLLVTANLCTGGTASWYGDELRGKLMANGKPFNPDALTCASWNFPLGAKLEVTYKGRSVFVTVTDRGPHKRLNREIDLSRAAFARLADPRLGLIEVRVFRRAEHDGMRPVGICSPVGSPVRFRHPPN